MGNLASLPAVIAPKTPVGYSGIAYRLLIEAIVYQERYREEGKIEVRKCRNCGRTLCGQHPQVDPSQHGATAHRVGNGVLTRAHALHYGIGVPMRKVPTILRELCGVSITQSAIQQDATRRNQAEVGEESQQLRTSVKDAKRGFTDDTGWRINGKSASMMGFDTDEATVYKSVW